MSITRKKVVVILLGLLIAGSLFHLWRVSKVDFSYSEYLFTIYSIQRELHLSFSDLLRSIKSDGYGTASTLIGLSFTYGIFHAAGPGHGKIIISTYLFSNESELRRGIFLSFASSLAQGLTAIVLVTAAFWVFDYTIRQTQGLANNLDLSSFFMITAVGLFIFLTRLIRLLRSALGSKVVAGSVFHVHADDCDHQHGPRQSDIKTPINIATFVGVVSSVGIRPCSGALIVLLLSYSLNIPLAGILSVLAMSVGTAMTICLLATFSVYLRLLTNRTIKKMPDGERFFSQIADFFAALGGLVIFVFGLIMFIAVLLEPAHPFK